MGSGYSLRGRDVHVGSRGLFNGQHPNKVRELSCVPCTQTVKMASFLLLALAPAALGLEAPGNIGRLPAMGWNSWYVTSDTVCTGQVWG